MATSEVHISLFGNLQVSVEGVPIAALATPRLQSMMAWLVVNADQPAPKEHLAFLLWPESSGAQARTNLRQLLHHLRRAFPVGNTLLRVDHSTVQWRRGACCTIDVIEFASLVAFASEAKQKNDARSELEALRRAAKLYVDDVMPTAFDAWLIPVRQTLRTQLSGALFRLASLLQESGDLAGAMTIAERLVAHEPTMETSYQTLMRLQIANKDRASAVRTYHRCKAVLRRELGIQPGHATVTLLEDLLHATVPKRLQPPSAVPGKEETYLLIGRGPEQREMERAWTLAKSGCACAVLVSGEPGIGKTRFAEAFLQGAERAGHAVVRSRCHVGQGQVAYAPVAQWLRADQMRECWTGTSSAQQVELARLVPEISRESPIAIKEQVISDSWQKQHLYSALGAAFSGSARPLILFVDDLHWCDTDSLEWLQWLLTSRPAQRLLVIGTVRQEEVGRDHPLAALRIGLRQADVLIDIPLPPLNSEESGKLACQTATTPKQSRAGRDLSIHEKQSPLHRRDDACWVAEHAYSRGDQRSPCEPFRRLVRTGRFGQRCGSFLFFRAAGESL